MDSREFTTAAARSADIAAETDPVIRTELDYVDVVVHIPQPEAREYCELDLLYSECPELDVSRITLPRFAESPAMRLAE